MIICKEVTYVYKSERSVINCVNVDVFKTYFHSESKVLNDCSYCCTKIQVSKIDNFQEPYLFK